MKAFRNIFTALAILAVANTNTVQGTGNFTRLIEHDCDGNFYMMPSQPELGFAVGLSGRFNSLFKAVRQYILKTAECHCPDLSTTGKSDLYYGAGVGMVLKFLQGSNEWSRSDLDNICNGASYFSKDGDNLNPVDVEAGFDSSPWNSPPSTCTAEKYATDGCFLKWPIMGVSLQIAVKQCPSDGNNQLPFISVSAAGDLPDYFLRPCQSDSDCGTAANMTCDNPVSLIDDEETDSMGDILTSLVEDLELFNTETCSFSSSLMGSKMSTVFMKGMGQMMQMATNTATYTKTCGMKLIRETVTTDKVQVIVEDLEPEGNDCDYDNSKCQPGLYCKECRRDYIYNETSYDYYYGPSNCQGVEDMYTSRCFKCDGCDSNNYEDCDICEQTREIQRIPDVFQSWDGVLPGGTNVRNWVNGEHPRATSIEIDSRVTSECQSSYDSGKVVPIMQHQCRFADDDITQGAYLLTPLSPMHFGAQTPLLQQMVKQMALPAFTQIIDACHSSNLDLMKDFTPWHIGFWIRIFSAGRKPTDPPANYAYTLWEKFHEIFEWDSTVEFPSTCSEERWKNEQVCQLQFTKLNELFDMPENSMVLRLTLSKCDEDAEALPFMYMDCVGDKCDYLFEPYNVKTCSSNSECDSGKCTSFDEYKIKFSNGYTGGGILPWAFWNNEQPDQCGTGKTDILELVDLAHMWSGEPPLTTQQKSSANSWCETVLQHNPADVDDFDEKAENFFENIYTESTTSLGNTHYTIRGLQDWAKVDGGDGCAYGIDGGNGGAHRPGGSQRVTTTAPPAASSLVITFPTGGSTLEAMSDAQQLAFVAAFVASLKTLPSFISSTRNFDASDATLTQTVTGLAITMNLPTSVEETGDLAAALDTAENQLLQAVSNSNSLPAGTTITSLSSTAGAVITPTSAAPPTSSSDASNLGPIIGGAVFFPSIFFFSFSCYMYNM